MPKHPRFTLFALISFVSASCAFAQTTTPAESDPTAPAAASSPHQRDATKTDATETPTTTETSTESATAADPSSSSTPHQRQATKMGDEAKSHDQMMKDCVAKERAKSSATTQEQAKKNCATQMKSDTPMPAG